jgi:type IV pilus assembly protein PilV
VNEKGFSLIEVLVTLAILALGVLALASLQVISIKGSAFSKDATAATAIAQSKIESIKGAAFGSVVSGSETTNGMNVAWVFNTVGASPYRYQNIAVTVTWGPTGNTKSVNLTTMVSE